MSRNETLVSQLADRLPELLWRLNKTQKTINPRLLPPGLFTQSVQFSYESCIHEIQKDLKNLKAQKDTICSDFLAKRIGRKIDVLVQICRQDKENEATKETRKNFGLHAITTRQKWLQELEGEINQLLTQKKAFAKRLHQTQKTGDVEAELMIKGELGELERRLTEAQEAWKKATMQVV